ncbi:MAG: Na+/H+ antiporter subunit E [Lachnospiraceae bacterium]|jgi:multicomponent Na+:H+ antiporter subunit E|nr:Na+/H+ antiporter subunit E [uncultured Acetatifactor sp.]MCI9220718.1 Na+/H+ antiporter subunit E [Lachnospiraceae bacterium]
MFLLYFLLWVIFNGRVTLEICLLGLVIAGALLAFSCRFMEYSLARERKVYRSIFLFPRYCRLLVTEIVKANVSAMRMILTQREEIEPALVSFCTDLKSQAGKALLANTITLTPGTITVTLETCEYTVHCLDESMAEGIQESAFVAYIRKFEETL